MKDSRIFYILRDLALYKLQRHRMDGSLELKRVDTQACWAQLIVESLMAITLVFSLIKI
jgi:hypothetical protein